ncbi:NAD-dependent epimerase/dehydratase family protein [Flavobacteriaceae bacterium R38]|nr:NAD-dependent epimerase/dehydratase family protein [Flavobacteriaceae bacterium R38]
MNTKILIIGACGQIGSELTLALRTIYGDSNVIASDIREGNDELMNSGPFEILDVTDKIALESIIRKYQIEEVYLMAAMLSATAEKFPEKAWQLNMNSLLSILDFAKDGLIKKIFWPSSIAVFGPTTPRENTPQQTVTEPTTVYGISKLAGERWCEYYFNNYDVDVRSIRYPGLISWKTNPGGGTTDYAVDIYHQAIQKGSYECFLSEGTILPMMYMDDAIKATIGIMQADKANIKERSSYNLAAISFAPEEVTAAIKKHIPEFTISYDPDFRQKIADSWPQSIDDAKARSDWGWKHEFDLASMTKAMLTNLKATIG